MKQKTNEDLVKEMFPYYEDMEDSEVAQTVFKRKGAIEMAKLKDYQFTELVKRYIRIGADNGEPVHLLENLLTEI